MTKTAISEARRMSQWVQTDRAAHEAWAKLSIKSPKASALLHVLAASIEGGNAVVASHKLLAKMMGCHTETVKRAVAELEAGRWIKVKRVSGTPCVYVLNANIVWFGARENLRTARFNATVLLDAEEQDDKGLVENQEPLRQVPTMFVGEQQLPSGPGLEPPSQPSFDGLEPELPAIQLGRSGIDEPRSFGQIAKGAWPVEHEEEDRRDV